MISLCIISRKEDSESLGNALRSCYKFVDEIIVIDTGAEPFSLSKNGREEPITNEVLSDFGTIKLIPFKWTGSFADARNFSFEQATGDVIFWIDSDDTVTNPENLPKLAKEITDGSADWIYSQYNYSRDEWGNLTAVHWKPRLFRKGSVTWKGNVHEDTVPTEGVIQVKDEEIGPRIFIEHHADEAHHVSSNERNLGIMMAEYENDGEKTDPRTIQYIAMALEGMRRYRDAIPFFQRHISVTGSNSDKFWSLHRLATSLHRLGDHRNAISVTMDSLKLYPEWNTPYFDLGGIYYDLGDYAKCLEWTLVGLEKENPDILDVVDEVAQKISPLQRMVESYLNLNNPALALDTAKKLMRLNPKMKLNREMYDLCREACELENYVRAFITVAQEFKKYDRVKTVQLFDLIPAKLDDDLRIQQLRNAFVPPKKWGEKSIVIYCGDSPEDWAYPSIFTGIGGSETAVIHMGEELTKLGYSVTVYNRCGHLKGNYNGVEYKPYYHFNPKDIFDTLISWRNPGLFMHEFTAKRKYLWLHDILYPEAINAKIIANADKILFLSKWHSKNVPIPEDKVFITNNGINPDDFKNLPEKRPNSLIWSSSYDRGLLPFIKNILPLIKTEIPDVTLDVAYGWQNILKEMDQVPHLKELYTELSPILENTPGITHHGRISHVKLAQLMGSSMVYPYASEFGETNMISSQMAQTAGCFIVMPEDAGGSPEYVRFGKVLEGRKIYSNKKLQKDFTEEVISYLKNPKDISVDVNGFSWEETAKSWIDHLL